MYAVVDIETTGGSARTHAITEIAIIRIEEGKEVDRFQTLINPGRLIPRNITTITGITDEMVADAPSFNEVAKEVFDLLSNAVFVAHNVSFDYGFVRQHLLKSGYKWQAKRLCTVRLSRKLIPGLYSYSLGKIAQQLGHHINGRHRAMGDCDFTAKLFKILLEKDQEGHIAFALNARSTEATLPPHLPRSSVENIPSTIGVYKFLDNTEKVIYVGKAKNLKKRVREHFRGNTHTGYKNRFAEKITDLKWIECPNELISLLVEAREIKANWPRYNRAMKRVTLNWGIFHFEDQNGYGRLSVGRVGKWARPVSSFRSEYEARQMLVKMRDEHMLCARFCDLQDAGGKCVEEVHGECKGACIGDEKPSEYNARLTKALDSLKINGSMIIKESGFTPDEQTIVLIQNGRYKGFGTAPIDADLSDFSKVLEYIHTGYDDQDMQSILHSHLQRNPNTEVVLYD